MRGSCYRYEAYRALRESDAWDSMPEARKRAIEGELRDFVLGGVALEVRARGAAVRAYRHMLRQCNACTVMWAKSIYVCGLLAVCAMREDGLHGLLSWDQRACRSKTSVAPLVHMVLLSSIPHAQYTARAAQALQRVRSSSCAPRRTCENPGCAVCAVRATPRSGSTRCSRSAASWPRSSPTTCWMPPRPSSGWRPARRRSKVRPAFLFAPCAQEQPPAGLRAMQTCHVVFVIC